MANEKRVRVLNCWGTLAATLLVGDTTISFLGPPNLPSIDATKHAALIIEPDSTNEEIVYVTAYNAGDVTATIVRAREGTTAKQHGTGAPWLHGPTKRDNAAGRLAFMQKTSGSAVFPPASYAAAILADLPLVYLRLEETSGNPADSSGNGHPGVYGGTPTRGVAGIVGNAVTMTGSAGAGGSIAIAGLGTVNAPFTIEFWFKLASNASSMKVVGSRGPSDGSFDIGIGDTQAHADWGNGSAWYTTAQATTIGAPSINTWHHFAVVLVSATSVLYYRDGAQVGSNNPGGLVRACDATHTLTFGWSGLAGDTSWNGQLDEFAFYTSALSAAQILAHYNAGASGGVATNWTDLDTGLDLVVPAFPGDLVEVGLNALLESTSPDTFFDVASVVAGAKVNYWGGSGASTDLGIPGWARAESTGNGLAVPWFRRLLAADIDTGGLLTARLVARGGPRLIDASAARPLQFWAKNHGPQEAS